ncbi:hypothetical protein B0H12DRAFT_1004539, partial [Mycena haematopus]
MPLDLVPPSAPRALPSATIQNLHKLIYAVKLPKTTNAKSCTVPLADWNTIRALAAALVQQPAANSNTSRIESLTSKLDTLMSRIESLPTMSTQTPPVSTSPTDKTYAAVAASFPATSLAPSHATRDTSFDLVLTPKDRLHRAFANETHFAIQQQFNALMTRMEFDSTPSARAVAKFRNGDVRLTLARVSDVTLLQEHSDVWLPAFSSLLKLHSPSYAIVMHRVPTDFEVGNGVFVEDDDSWENDIRELVQANEIDSESLVQVHWIGRQSSEQVRKTKKFSSLVLHFSDPSVANYFLTTRLALHGHLHRTEKYCPQPLQCFNCHRFGHIAAQCKHS